MKISSNANSGNCQRFIMIGGFLGAGKTTTIFKLALSLKKKGLRVGLITNDQAAGLVDTALLDELDLPVREIAGGCFCCQSGALVDALQNLEVENRPDVFLAEPVGSCTDLVATVSLPLEKIYKKNFTLAPYTVVVDPYRVMQTLNVEGESLFSDDVNYIYRKQLEEAEIIAINKIDVISHERLIMLKKALELEYPEARIIEISSREGIGLASFFDLLINSEGHYRNLMDLDYERYATGEAKLGWLNLQGKIELQSSIKSRIAPRKLSKKNSTLLPSNDKSIPFEGNEWLLHIATGIKERLSKRKIEIAHLKLSLAMQDAEGKLDLAAVQCVRSGSSPEPTRSMQKPFTGGQLLINLRAEGNPDVLASETFKVLADQLEQYPSLSLTNVITNHFRPSKPVPTHRISKV